MILGCLYYTMYIVHNSGGAVLNLVGTNKSKACPMSLIRGKTITIFTLLLQIKYLEKPNFYKIRLGRIPTVPIYSARPDKVGMGTAAMGVGTCNL